MSEGKICIQKMEKSFLYFETVNASDTLAIDPLPRYLVLHPLMCLYQKGLE